MMDTTRAWRYMPEVTPPWVRVEFDKLPADAALVLFVDDEEEEFTFNGTTFRVHPAGVTVLELPDRGQHWAGFTAADLANAAEKQLARWGVVQVPAVVLGALKHPKSKAQAEGLASLERLIDYAKVAWENGNTEWAMQVYQERVATVEKYRPSGLKPPAASQAQLTAEKWLKTRNLLR